MTRKPKRSKCGQTRKETDLPGISQISGDWKIIALPLVEGFPIPDLLKRIAALKWALDLTREAGGWEESGLLDTMLTEHKCAMANSITEDQARKLLQDHRR